MIRKFSYLFIGLIIWFCNQTYAAPVSSENVPPDIKKILDRGTLIVALYNTDVPPFFAQNASGELTGYDISIAQNIAQQLGVKVVFDRNAHNYDEVIEEVSHGKADVGISLLSITASRELIVNFSTAYNYLPQALLYNRLQAAQNKYSNLAKQIVHRPLTIGVLEKSAYLEYARQTFPEAHLITYHSPAKGMEDVRDNKIFGFYFNEIEIKNWIKENSKSNLYVSYDLIEDKVDPIGIAVSWQTPQLRRWINCYLFVNTQNGILKKLQKQNYEKN